MVVTIILAAHAASQAVNLAGISSAFEWGVPVLCVGGLAGIVRGKLKSGGLIRTQAQGPLAGIKIVDCSVVISAPWSAALLSELGAEVVKVEVLSLPDSSRGLGNSPALGMAGCTGVVSKGKQSIILDLKDKTGKGLEAFHELIKASDVFLENFRPGATERMGIPYDALKKINPNLIYVSVTGFGSDGPNSGQRIYDPIIQVAVGAPGIQQENKGMLVGQAIFDKTTAQYSHQAILAALIARDRGAGGQQVNISMQEVGLAWMFPDGMNTHVWSKGESTTYNRTANVLEGLKPPSDAIADCAAVLASPKTKPYIVQGEHALFGGFISATYPVDFSKTKLAPRPAAPMMGEHTTKVLSDLGYAQGDIDAMLESKAAVSTKSLLAMKKAGAEAAAAQAPAEGKAAADAAVADLAKKIMVFGIIERFQGGNHFAQNASVVRAGLPTVPAGAGPLDGMKVLDASDLVAGPLAASILGDQGADVIKAEQVGATDSSRNRGPSKVAGMGAMFMVLNRNKRSVAVDTKKPEGQALLQQLAIKADVVIIDTDGALKIDYAEVSAQNPQVIFVEIAKGGGELDAQALSGLCSFQKDSSGKRVLLKCFVAEKATGMYAAGAASAALFARGRGAGGQRLQVNMLKASVHFAMCDVMWNDIWTNPKAMAIFPTLPELYNLTTYKCGTQVFTGALSDKEWSAWCKTNADTCQKFMKEGEMEKWATMMGRLTDIKRIVEFGYACAATIDYPEGLRRCKESETILGKVMYGEECLNDPQVKHMQTIASVQSSAGTYRMPKPTARFSATPASIRTGAPALGEHTAKACSDWGIAADEVKSAMSSGGLFS